MVARAASGTPKSSEGPGKTIAGLDVGKVKDLKGIEEIIEHVKKGDWAAMVGAIMTMWKEYFGSPEEKAEIAKAREAAKKEQETKDKAKKNLGALRSDVDKAKGEEGEKGAEEEKKPELVKNPELGDGSELMFIGDSVPHGMELVSSWKKRPGFIGKDGMSTFQVLERLKAEKGRLKGKKKAMIYCAGNNILSTSTEDLVGHMVEMAKICSEADVPEIIVNTQFPPISNYSKNIGEEKFKDLKVRNEALRTQLLQAHKDGRFPAGVRVVDLTKPFSDEKDEMKEEFVDPKSSDYLHPRGAYAAAIHYMQSEESKAA